MVLPVWLEDFRRNHLVDWLVVFGYKLLLALTLAFVNRNIPSPVNDELKKMRALKRERAGLEKHKDADKERLAELDAQIEDCAANVRLLRQQPQLNMSWMALDLFIKFFGMRPIGLYFSKIRHARPVMLVLPKSLTPSNELVRSLLNRGIPNARPNEVGVGFVGMLMSTLLIGRIVRKVFPPDFPRVGFFERMKQQMKMMEDMMNTAQGQQAGPQDAAPTGATRQPRVEEPVD